MIFWVVILCPYLLTLNLKKLKTGKIFLKTFFPALAKGQMVEFPRKLVPYFWLSWWRECNVWVG